MVQSINVQERTILHLIDHAKWADIMGTGKNGMTPFQFMAHLTFGANFYSTIHFIQRLISTPITTHFITTINFKSNDPF